MLIGHILELTQINNPYFLPQLYKWGYKNIDYLDGSPKMLEVAKSRRSHIYRKFDKVYLGNDPIDAPDSTYLNRTSCPPNNIKLCTSLSSFKNALYKYLIAKPQF